MKGHMEIKNANVEVLYSVILAICGSHDHANITKSHEQILKIQASWKTNQFSKHVCTLYSDMG